MKGTRSQHDFKVGDIVELKSGGPPMTVSELNPYGTNTIKCQWFAGKKMEHGQFPPESLLHSKEKSG